ncbi:hypothetical protein T07_14074 [Trichinella nelsoni]|uniref:Uncharacterized protein n=1 Tax=Trichinella nelsoni TaxID=6336 RepID=A0A0V0S1Z1_9BILA|nr:hypothetical protein T07_14074 [Trichinella nelsoni]
MANASSSEEQNCPKSTHTEFRNLCQSQFTSIRRMYHELPEKEEALRNVEDLNTRAELEEESASTKRHTIGVMRLIGKLFLWKMINLSILCDGFMNRGLYVVTGYCFTWWTCGHATHFSIFFTVYRGGVSLRISSKIYPRSLFSLTPNVIG